MESKLDVLSYNGGMWWALAMLGGPVGEMWRRCYWWREEFNHADDRSNGSSTLIFRTCQLCRRTSSILESAHDEIIRTAAVTSTLRPSPMAALMSELRRAEECAEEGKVCSYCGKICSSTAPKGRDVKIGPITVERWHKTLSFDGGVWWMSAMDGEMWRRCHWWKEECVDGDETMLVFHRCHACRLYERILNDAMGRIQCERAEATTSVSSGETGCSDISDGTWY